MHTNPYGADVDGGRFDDPGALLRPHSGLRSLCGYFSRRILFPTRQPANGLRHISRLHVADPATENLAINAFPGIRIEGPLTGVTTRELIQMAVEHAIAAIAPALHERDQALKRRLGFVQIGRSPEIL